MISFPFYSFAFRFFQLCVCRTRSPCQCPTFLCDPLNGSTQDCLQLDTKLVCVQCKALQCGCPASVDKYSISSLPDMSKHQQHSAMGPPPPPTSTQESRTSRFAWNSSTSSADTDERPASVRLASILGIKRATPGDSDSASLPQTESGMKRTESRESMTSSPAANWLRDKYQLATSKLMSKV